MSQFQRAFKTIVFLNLFLQVLMHCYQMNMLSFHTTETSDYRLFMSLHKNNTITTITTVLKEVAIPMWNIILIQHNKGVRRGSKVEPHKVLYNATYKVCEFWRSWKRIRVFNNIPDMLFNKQGMGGNMSLKCPLAVGTYVMLNIHVPSDTPILKFMYLPNTIYTLYGNIYSMEGNKKMILKCTYEINATIVKSC